MNPTRINKREALNALLKVRDPNPAFNKAFFCSAARLRIWAPNVIPTALSARRVSLNRIWSCCHALFVSIRRSHLGKSEVVRCICLCHATETLADNVCSCSLKRDCRGASRA